MRLKLLTEAIQLIITTWILEVQITGTLVPSALALALLYPNPLPYFLLDQYGHNFKPIISLPMMLKSNPKIGPGLAWDMNLRTLEY